MQAANADDDGTAPAQVVAAAAATAAAATAAAKAAAKVAKAKATRARNIAEAKKLPTRAAGRAATKPLEEYESEEEEESESDDEDDDDVDDDDDDSSLDVAREAVPKKVAAATAPKASTRAEVARAEARLEKARAAATSAQKQADATRKKAGAEATPSALGSQHQRLTELKSLRDGGLMTEEQWKAAVDKVMGISGSVEKKKDDLVSVEDTTSKAMRELKAVVTSWVGTLSAPALCAELWDAVQSTTDEWLRMELLRLSTSSASRRAFRDLFLKAGKGITPPVLLQDSSPGDDGGRAILRVCARDFLRHLAAAVCTSNSVAQNPKQGRVALYEEYRSLLNEDQTVVHGAVFNMARKKLRNSLGAKPDDGDDDDEEEQPWKRFRSETFPKKGGNKGKANKADNKEYPPAVWNRMTQKEKSAVLSARRKKQ